MMIFQKSNRKNNRTLLRLLLTAMVSTAVCILSGCGTASIKNPIGPSEPVCNAVTEQSFTS